jgi:hypothetical protein
LEQKNQSFESTDKISKEKYQTYKPEIVSYYKIVHNIFLCCFYYASNWINNDTKKCTYSYKLHTYFLFVQYRFSYFGQKSVEESRKLVIIHCTLFFSFCSYYTLFMWETIHTFIFRMIYEKMSKKKIRSFKTIVVKKFNEYIWFGMCLSKEVTRSKWLLFFQLSYNSILNGSNIRDGMMHEHIN